MPSPYIAYVTSENERWDWIAWKFYGDPTLYGPIIEANPNVPIFGAFDSGLTLQIPILEKASDLTNDLPPWETL